MTDALLIFNAGSSSLRCALYSRRSLEPLCRLHVEAVATTRQKITWSGPFAARLADQPPPTATDHAALSEWVLQTLATSLPDVAIVAAGHRVVHGGARHDRPVLVEPSVIADIERLAPLAPQHQPRNLAAIQALAKARPGLPQVACFDTAFHRHMPRIAQLFGLPRDLADGGILRYGFHGLSYEYLAGKLPEFARANGRVILAHLGHGASLCAVREGRSVATTMGFSALDGLMMGTRCGAIDPGVLLYLQQVNGMHAAELSRLLYDRSGLLGVSGISDDVRVLEASDDPRAREALDLFAYRAAGEIGALVTALGGLDVVVFSAGIGEHSARMRQHICDRLGWIGVALDAQANEAHARRISDVSSPVDVFVISTDEEITIARGTRSCAGT